MPRSEAASDWAPLNSKLCTEDKLLGIPITMQSSIQRLLLAALLVVGASAAGDFPLCDRIREECASLSEIAKKLKEAHQPTFQPTAQP